MPTTERRHLLQLWMLFAVLVTTLPDPSRSILLCDGDCKSNTVLEICQAIPENKTVLNVMALFPCNTDGFRARGLTVAAQMAVKNVAKETGLLDGYRLNLAVDNTMCDQLEAIRAFIQQLQEALSQNKQRYMIIGPGCSVGAALTAETAPFYSLTQIGYTTTSDSLSDQRLYPNFLRAISSDNASVATVRAVVKEFGWEQIALVSIRDDLFSNLTRLQMSVLQQDNVNVLTEQLSFENPTDEVLENIVNQLNTSGARVVLFNVYENQARSILCLLHQRGMVYPRYTFMTYYWYSEFWWTDGVNGTNCTVQELTDMVFRSIALDHFPTPTQDERLMATNVGYSSPDVFWDDFLDNLDALDYPRNEALRQAAYVYDAVWMAAFALNNASIELENGVLGAARLEDFNHFVNEDLAHDINQVILHAARNTVFQGVSGKVKLNQYGDREPTRKVYQYLYTDVIDPNNATNMDFPFASVNDNGQLIFFNGNRTDTVFPDGVPMAAAEITIDLALFIVYTILACVGIAFAVVCIVFNLVFKKKRIVKLSSPYLNVLLISGAIMFYIDVILLGLDTNFANTEAVDILRCQFSMWLASIGFSLLFGTMLAKTWRVYYIFKNIRLKKRPMKDWVLFLMVVAMVALDIVFLIVVSVDIFRLKLQQQPLMPQPNGEIPQLIRTCTSAASTYWVPVLLGYKSLYLLVGIFLAVQTYNVKLKRLRDSKLIVACVFTTCVVTVVATVVAFAVNVPNVAYAVYGVFILVVVTAILFILFGTLMIELWKNPTGETSVATFAEPTVGTSYLDNSTTKASIEDQMKISELKETIQSLKEQIDTIKRQSSVKPSEHDHTPEHDVGSRTNLLSTHPDDNHMTSHVADPFEEKGNHVLSNDTATDLSPDHVEMQETLKSMDTGTSGAINSDKDSSV